MKKVLLSIGVLVIVAFGVIQLIPVDRSNPPVEADIPTSPAVKTILKRACYDCHSNETVWPSYSRVAPVSWVVAWDVRKGREELNFSTWNQYSLEERAKKVKESWEKVEEGEMAPWFYVLLHPEAGLEAEDRRVLRDWGAGSSGLIEDDDDEESEEVPRHE